MSIDLRIWRFVGYSDWGVHMRVVPNGVRPLVLGVCWRITGAMGGKRGYSVRKAQLIHPAVLWIAVNRVPCTQSCASSVPEYTRSKPDGRNRSAFLYLVKQGSGADLVYPLYGVRTVLRMVEVCPSYRFIMLPIVNIQ